MSASRFVDEFFMAPSMLAFEIHPVPFLEPRFERETFSGGTNDSARARNAECRREALASTRFDGRRVYCAPCVVAMIEREARMLERERGG